VIPRTDEDVVVSEASTTTALAELVRDGVALERAAAQDVLRWAIDRIPRFAVTSSFGADSAVLLHLLAQVACDVPVLFLDTGFHFAETLEYRRELVGQLGLTDVRDLRPDLTVAAQATEHGGGLYLRDPDRCCAIRKVAPLDAALADLDGWATGVRREQTADRADTPVVGMARRGDRELVKVAPLARWSATEVEAYRRRHDAARSIRWPTPASPPSGAPRAPGQAPQRIREPVAGRAWPRPNAASTWRCPSADPLRSHRWTSTSAARGSPLR
jgi:phosphoadenosine phosphosulfate reductase